MSMDFSGTRCLVHWLTREYVTELKLSWRIRAIQKALRGTRAMRTMISKILMSPQRAQRPAPQARLAGEIGFSVLVILCHTANASEKNIFRISGATMLMINATMILWLWA